MPGACAGHFFVARGIPWRKQKFAVQHFGYKQET
jgi:hypothetical protein